MRSVGYDSRSHQSRGPDVLPFRNQNEVVEIVRELERYHGFLLPRFRQYAAAAPGSQPLAASGDLTRRKGNRL